MSKPSRIETTKQNQPPTGRESHLPFSFADAKSGRFGSAGNVPLRSLLKAATAAGGQLVADKGFGSSVAEIERLYPGRTPKQILADISSIPVCQICEPRARRVLEIISELIVEMFVGIVVAVGIVAAMTRPMSSWEFGGASQPTDLEAVSEWLFRR